jgi:4-hydroxybenzoyl-CoA thioesterase
MARVHRFERRRVIHFSHCDPAGIVFFPHYLTMFNDLVEDWVTEGLGISYADLLGRRRIGLPTVSLKCEFTAISRMGDEVVFGLSLLKLGRSSLQLQLGCRCDDEQRVQIEQVLVATDLHTHQSTPVPDDLRHSVTRYQQE